MTNTLLNKNKELLLACDHYDKLVTGPILAKFPVMLRSKATQSHMKNAGTKKAPLGHDGVLLSTDIMLDLNVSLSSQSNRRYITDDIQNHNLDLMAYYLKGLKEFCRVKGLSVGSFHSKSMLRKPGVPATSTPGSFHIYGAAVDLTLDGLTARQLYDIVITAVKEGILPVGEYFLYPGFVHFSPSNAKDNCSTTTGGRVLVQHYGGRLLNTIDQDI